MTRTTMMMALATTLTMSACGDADEEFNAEDFEAGSFVFTSVAVTDACLDGAFSTLFLPEGDGSTSDWQYQVELPAWTSLPATYTVQIQEPFGDVDVTVTDGGVGLMSINGAAITEVEFNADSYPDCLVDMDVGVEIVIDDNDTVHGTATMSTSNVVGASCPVFAADPCAVVLDFDGVRQ